MPKLWVWIHYKFTHVNGRRGSNWCIKVWNNCVLEMELWSVVLFGNKNCAQNLNNLWIKIGDLPGIARINCCGWIVLSFYIYIYIYIYISGPEIQTHPVLKDLGIWMIHDLKLVIYPVLIARINYCGWMILNFCIYNYISTQLAIYNYTQLYLDPKFKLIPFSMTYRVVENSALTLIHSEQEIYVRTSGRISFIIQEILYVRTSGRISFIKQQNATTIITTMLWLNGY